MRSDLHTQTAMKTAAFAMTLLMGGAALAQSPETGAAPDRSATTPSGPASDSNSAPKPTISDSAPGAPGAMPPSRLNVVPSVSPDRNVAESIGSTPDSNAPAPPGASSGGSATVADAPPATTAAAAPGGTVVQPGNRNPSRDARNIKVKSDPAVVPDGYNGVSGTGTGGPMLDPATNQPVAARDEYPACSRKVTDNCVQTYERRRKRS